jgi:homoserine O-acetyltransferase
MPLQEFHYPQPFPLESGKVLPGFTLAYHTGGNLNTGKTNVVWVCHALTGNSQADDWWGGLIGAGKLIDPENWFWVCANMPGSCYGSTYALSTNPDTGQPWYHDFPQLTHRDMVRAFDLLRQHLELPRIALLIGGSTGGQHVLEWAVQQPEVFDAIAPIATNAFHSPWGIAFNEAQRMAIEADPSWKSRHPDAGKNGMRAARAIALLSYRGYAAYGKTQAETDISKTDGYRAATYQQYQGDKLYQRFDAFAYWTLSKAMDSHHLGRGRGSAEAALRLIRAKALVIGVEHDVLFPAEEQEFLAAHIPGAELAMISSPYGHDGFLIEWDQLTELLGSFLRKHRIGPAQLPPGAPGNSSGA